jgi:mono/diheme cytochrome c family protein
MTMTSICSLLMALGAVLADPASPVDYDRDVKPILVQKCVGCHGADKQKADLRLDTAAAAIKGGNSGEAIVPGKAGESLLIQAVTVAEGVEAMPPKESDRLTPQQIAILKAWIDQGAKFPADEVGAQAATSKSNHWSFQPITRPPVPEIQNPKSKIQNPIDNFIFARLAKDNLTPSPEADRITLIRRLSLDLLGLLPSIAEVDEFVADDRPDAYERLVDRLLASPHYGERWARHWLDLAHYADSNGYTRDTARSIWRYRDWVAEALNRDLPFDQFVIEQLAGDLLPDATIDQKIATGFLRNTMINEEGGTDPEQFRVEAVVDRVGTVGTVFLGLTVACAQCHDHKFDPLTQRDFYSLFAFLNQCDEPSIEVPTAEQLKVGLMEKRAELRKRIAELEKEFASKKEDFIASVERFEKEVTDDEKTALGIAAANTLGLSKVMRTDADIKALHDAYKLTARARKEFPMLEEIAKLKASEPKFTTTLVLAERKKPRETFIHLRGDFLRHGVKVEPAVPVVLTSAALPSHSGRGAGGEGARGTGDSPVRTGETPVPRSKDNSTPPQPSPLPEGEGTTSGRSRLDLARWLAGPDNPLTARVTVNRIWQQYFGRGLVETENDFGVQGSKPTHPELLDWLASEFVAPSNSPPLTKGGTGGLRTSTDRQPANVTPPTPPSEWGEKSIGAWSLKRFHKLIVTSATYKQSSRRRPEMVGIDLDNKLLARQSRLRIDAEVIRDAGLAASGLLTRTLGGPPVHPPQPTGVYDFTQDKKPWDVEKGANRFRRGLYTYLWRSAPYPAMVVFDFPDANANCTRRMRSNTPLQSLTLANDQAFFEFAQGLASRVLKVAPATDADRVRHAFRTCLARQPDSVEMQRLLSLVDRHRSDFAASSKDAEQLAAGVTPAPDSTIEFATWTAVSRVLLNLDEFITRE